MITGHEMSVRAQSAVWPEPFGLPNFHLPWNELKPSQVMTRLGEADVYQSTDRMAVKFGLGQNEKLQ